MGVFIFLIAFLSLLFLFKNELLIYYLCHAFPSERLPEGPWEICILARKKQDPKKARLRIQILSEPALTDFISIPSFFLGPTFFVSKKLWDEWDLSERETILLWGHFMGLRYGILSRYFLAPDVFKIDRDVILESPKALALLPALEKLCLLHASGTTRVLPGLGLLGPSLLNSWPSLEERQKNVSSYLERLTLEKS